MGVLMRCIPVQGGNSNWFSDNPWMIAIIVVVVLLLLLWSLYQMCFRRKGRPILVQSMLNMRKRVKGEPTGGVITVVNTDIEGYSNLMKQSPALMTRALNLHNNVIRKARWNNFGYTVEQEGVRGGGGGRQGGERRGQGGGGD